jgi:P pilus assembly chaperone PapD
MKRYIKILGLFVFLLCSSFASANVMVYPMTLKINYENANKNQFKIFSKSDKTQYLKVYVAQVVNPATPQEHETPISIMSGTGIIASPQKIILPPGGEHTVRVRSLSTPNKEILYRVYVEPVTAEDSEYKENNAASVGINLTWGVLVYSPPASPISNLSVNIKNGTLENTGNIHTWVKDISLCSGSTPDTCRKTKVEKSLYPDLSMPLPSVNFEAKSIVVRYQTQESDMKSQRWSF